MLLWFFRSFVSPENIVVSYSLYTKICKNEANNIANNISNIIRWLSLSPECEIYKSRVIALYHQFMTKTTKTELIIKLIKTTFSKPRNIIPITPIFLIFALFCNFKLKLFFIELPIYYNRLNISP